MLPGVQATRKGWPYYTRCVHAQGKTMGDDVTYIVGPSLAGGLERVASLRGFVERTWIWFRERYRFAPRGGSCSVRCSTWRCWRDAIFPRRAFQTRRQRPIWTARPKGRARLI